MSWIEGVAGFAVGALVIGAILIVVLLWLRKIRQEKNPLVFLFELDNWRVHLLGRFVKFDENILIDVEGGEYKQFWGIRTESSFIIPATGAKEDIVVQDPDYPHIIILLASLIGFGGQADAHKQWLQEAFPEDIYENPPKLMNVPSNFVLVKAIGKRTWLQSKFKSIRSLFSQLGKVVTQYERQLQNIHSGYSKFIIARIQSWNEILVSGWESLLEGWDTTKRYTVIPLMVLCRLLHIPLSRVVYSGMAEVLQHGGMHQQAQFAQMMRQGINELNKGMQLVGVERPLLEATSQKVEELRQRAMQGEQKASMYENAFRQLSQHFPNLPSLPSLETPPQQPQPAPQQHHQQQEET